MLGWPLAGSGPVPNAVVAAWRLPGPDPHPPPQRDRAHGAGPPKHLAIKILCYNIALRRSRKLPTLRNPHAARTHRASGDRFRGRRSKGG